jgi:3-hydroxy-9,10-secoandrosta-1,3,5(10)-triene-9,17-dione monooxygenase reductase component
VLWSLAKTAHSLPVFMSRDYFAVHVLSNRQEALSNRFAKRGADKFDGLQLGRGAGGVPLLDGCCARFECRTAYRYEGGDHVIFVGEVLKFDHYGLPPLVYQSGTYAVAVKKPAQYVAEDVAYADDGIGRNALTYLVGRVFHQLRHRLRPVLERHGLNDIEHQIVGVLGIHDDREISELDSLLRLTGQRVDAAALAGLVARGYVSLAQRGGQAHAQLTERGRALNLELVSATKAIEEGALERFDAGEQQVLTHLVRRLAHDSAVEAPPLWKKAG